MKAKIKFFSFFYDGLMNLCYIYRVCFIVRKGGFYGKQ